MRTKLSGKAAILFIISKNGCSFAYNVLPNHVKEFREMLKEKVVSDCRVHKSLDFIHFI